MIEIKIVLIDCRHDGRIDLKRHVPKEPKSWLVGALAVSRDLGLGVVVEPARVSTLHTHKKYKVKIC